MRIDKDNANRGVSAPVVKIRPCRRPHSLSMLGRVAGGALLKVEVHRAKSGILYWRDKSFWELDITVDHETTGIDATAFAEVARTIAQGKKVPLLLYRAPGSIPSFDALRNFARVAPELLSAIAYWVASPQAAKTSQYVKELFLKGLPVEVFSNEADAVCWIREQLEHQTTHRYA